MDRVGVFVDAGYLLHCGAILLTGDKSRSTVSLDIRQAIAALKSFADTITSLPLLRIYWYDGTNRGPTAEHQELALANDVKVRLGIVNTAGEQKGVDSLIITDMITLARNRAMATAILVSGDEDLRVGVQQAQEFGVRVVLLGIEQLYESQSKLLRQEADALYLWRQTEIENFLTARTEKENAIDLSAEQHDAPLVIRVARGVLHAMSEDQRRELQELFESGRKEIPRDVDRDLLKTMKRELGRDVLPDERIEMRDAVWKEIEEAGPNHR